ncbi:MAG: hypothetical protein QXN63_04335 [Candidatus Bathyarchaeia archaeon]
MPSFRKDIFKASLLAIAIVSMLGTASYMLTPHKPTYALDIYTQKGGEGENTPSGSFFHNETITLFACVKDSTGHQLRDVLVNFTIVGPSNFVQKNATRTAGKGVGAISFTIPHTQPTLKTLVDVWNVDAEAKIGEETLRDSLTFEVKAVPSIDIYTNKGGKGDNVSSNVFFCNETITVYANVTEGTIYLPIENAPITFQVFGPLNKYENITYQEQKITNATGISFINLTTLIQSKPFEVILGVWNITATAENAIDKILFEIRIPPIRWIDVFTDKGGRGPHKPCLQPYHILDKLLFYAEVMNGTKPITYGDVIFTIVNVDTNLKWLMPPCMLNSSGIAHYGFPIPDDKEWLGTWILYANISIEGQVFSDTLIFEVKPAE